METAAPGGRKMRGETRSRREVVVGLLVAAAAVMGAHGVAAAADAAGGGASPPRDRESRRRWALARMDEMAQERLRCRVRLRSPEQVRACEAAFARRHRAYNEVYLEALRE
jgi:hypothetical protein